MRWKNIFKKIMGDFDTEYDDDEYNDNYINEKQYRNRYSDDNYTEYSSKNHKEIYNNELEEENHNYQYNNKNQNEYNNLINNDTDINLNLSVDIKIELFEDSSNVYLKALLPGTSEDDIYIDISRDSVIISGKRDNQHIVEDESYFIQEISWGEFNREIQLPREIDIDNSNAKLSKGMLFIEMQKTDRYRKKKLIPNFITLENENNKSKKNIFYYGKKKKNKKKY